MKVGIKYCGGCNPRYDRAAMVERIKAKHSDWEFEYANEESKYDKLLVVGGCTSCCAAFEQYDAAEVIKFRSEEDENKAD